MAPEVILRSNYNSKADIWSLGITAFELATAFPPRSNIHPMRVLFIIPREEPPLLDISFSPVFRSFVAKCLCKRASQRPTAAQLLQHPFITQHANVLPDQEDLLGRTRNSNSGGGELVETVARYLRWQRDQERAAAEKAAAKRRRSSNGITSNKSSRASPIMGGTIKDGWNFDEEENVDAVKDKKVRH